MEPRQNMRYRSSFDAQKLIANAKNELALAEPEMFKAFLLAIMTGLRRSEIDKLEWRAFDWQNLKIRVEPTEHLALKSEDASADVDLDPQLTKVLQEFYARRTGTFVIESPRPSRVGTSYLAYRCGPIFKRLATWLRAHGVASSKPLHCLRKEYGSLVCQKHGIFAASRALRHSDISVTAAHYVEPRAKATTGLGSLL
jgi:integrase